VLAAAVVIAACRTIEPLLGAALSASPVAVCVLWMAAGAVLAAASAVVAPPPTDQGSTT
jgi:hypothetical protein